MKTQTHSACPVARALDVVGEKWTLLILRDLFLHEARRFQEFQTALTGIAPNTLSARLKSLEADGIISRRLYCQHPPRPEYLLTDKGRALGPIVLALRDWGTRYATPE
ncbi:MAG: winged helix-turn-helix transcriptional regulator [Alphaproteobacteria bacterium]